LWVFLRAFGQSLDAVGLMVSFGLANVMAAIPLTPGGIGIVEGVYIPTLVGFKLRRSVAVVGVASYRIAQNFLPILVGGIFYASLRIGPWSIARRERLARLRTLAHEQDDGGRESQLDFLMRAWPKRIVPKMPDVDVPADQRAEAARVDAIVSLEDLEHRLTGDHEDPQV
jgi:putative heme transporter